MPAVLTKLPEKKVAQASTFLGAKLAALRRRQVATAALTGLAMALGVGVEMLALAMFVDWWLDLAWGIRLVLLIVQVALLGYIGLRHVVAPVLHQPDDDELALMVEKARSVFRSRLIAAVQLTRPGAIPAGASTSMVEAMVQETEAVAAPIDFIPIVSTEKLRKLGAVAMFASLFAISGLIFGGTVSRDLLQRT